MKFRLLVLVPALLLAPAAAEATVVRALDVEELTLRAEAVVRGVAVEASAEWAAGGRQIHTVTRVRVSSWMKGAADAGTLEVRTPGGTVGDLTQRVSGAPSLRVGEELVLFLRRLPGKARRFTVVGFSQGKFSVVREAGRTLVVREAGELGLLEADGQLRPAPRLGPLPLERLVDQVRKALPVGPRGEAAP